MEFALLKLDRVAGAPKPVSEGVQRIWVATAVLLAGIGEDRSRFPEPAGLLTVAGMPPVLGLHKGIDVLQEPPHPGGLSPSVR